MFIMKYFWVSATTSDDKVLGLKMGVSVCLDWQS